MAILNYSVSGAGENLVLLHPIGLDHTFWGALIDLAAASYRVTALDLPGHGLSPSLEGEGDILRYADAVANTLQSIGISSATFVGLSFGGMISQQVAIRYPALARRLVLGACGGAIPPEARAAVTARGSAALEGGMQAVLGTTVERWFSKTFMDSSIVKRVSARLLADNPEDWARGWQAIAGHNALSALRELQVPAIVVIGDSDLGTSVAAATALAGAIPGAELKVIPNAPHMLQLEYPEDYANAVLDFLGRTKPAMP